MVCLQVFHLLVPQPTPTWSSPNPAGPLCPQEGFPVNPGWLPFARAAAPGPLVSLSQPGAFSPKLTHRVPRQKQALSLQRCNLAWPLLKWQEEIGKKKKNLALYHRYCRAKQALDLAQCSNFCAPVHPTATAVRTKLRMRPVSIAMQEKRLREPAAPGLRLREMATFRSRWKSVALVRGRSP